MTTNIAHSGFNDLIDLVSTTTSRLGLAIANSRFYPEQPLPSPELRRPLPPIPRGADTIGMRHESIKPRPNVGPNAIKASARQAAPGRDQGLRQRTEAKDRGIGVKKAEGVVGEGMRNGLRYRKVDKRLIGAPTDFR